MKRWSALFLAIVMVLCSACGGKERDTGKDISEVETDSVEGTETASEESTSQPAEEESNQSESEETEPESSEPEAVFDEISDTVWATSNVNIRTAPNTQSEVVTVLRAGQSVTRTGIASEWSRVTYEGMTCYISSAYLTTEEPVAATAANVSGMEGIGILCGNGTGHIVAIDPGHQAHGNSEPEPIGPGASATKAKVATGTAGVATGVAESVLNLNVAMQLKDALLARGYQVLMIRETQDVNISNAERAAVANASGAEIFLRIHANGSANQSVSGIVTMCPSAANPYVSYLYDSSYRLSSLLVNNMCAATGANNQGVLGVDDMSGINWCTIPVSIVEMGYMSNPTEDTLMNSPDYQALLVQGMAAAVDQYFGQ